MPVDLIKFAPSLSVRAIGEFSTRIPDLFGQIVVREDQISGRARHPHAALTSTQDDPQARHEIGSRTCHQMNTTSPLRA